MKAYKITPSEKEQLSGQKMDTGVYFNPVQDINGQWFIFEIENECCGLGMESEFIAPESEPL